MRNKGSSPHAMAGIRNKGSSPHAMAEETEGRGTTQLAQDHTFSKR